MKNDEGSGVFYQLGWENIYGKKSKIDDIKLNSLHESFHNELKNVSLFGCILSTTAYIVLSHDKPEKYSSVLQYLVNKSTFSHELYATFLSTSILIENSNSTETSFKSILAKIPSYQHYYLEAFNLTKDFKGNYLKEIALSSLIISCFQSESAVTHFLKNKGLIKIEELNDLDFPDNRLELLKSNLTDSFLLQHFEAFCKKNKSAKGIELLKKTEINSVYYHKMLLPEYDYLQNHLINYFITKILEWFKPYGTESLPFEKNMEITKRIFECTNSLLLDKAKFDLKVNEKPYDIERNLLINFSSEKIRISSYKLFAEIRKIPNILGKDWDVMIGGSKGQQHVLLISKTKEDILTQYHFSKNDKKWFEKYSNFPMVFIRIRYTLEEKKIICLFHVDSVGLLEKLLTYFDPLPFFSNVSLHTWMYKDWKDSWTTILGSIPYPTFLFDLIPSHYLYHIFDDKFKKISFDKAILNMNGVKYSTLVFQGVTKTRDFRTPLFIMPLSDTTCNVISYYLLHNHRSFFLKKTIRY